MFHDHAGGRFKALDAFPRRVGVGDVVVAQFLALQLLGGHQRAGRGVQVAVERGDLVRILAVAQVLQLDEAAVGLTGELAQLGHARAFFELDAGEVVADGAVVLADAVERGDRQGEAGLVTELATGLEFVDHGRVLGRIGQHRHVFPILRRTAHHGRAADVDVLDGVFQRAAGLGHRGFKRVEIDDEQVDGVDAVGFQRGHVLRQVAARQQAAVHLGVQRFHAAIEHFGECGDFGHLGHGQPFFCQQFGRSTGGNQGHTQFVQGLGQLNDAGFVGDGNECSHGNGSRKV